MWFDSIWPSPSFVHFLGLIVFLFGICFRLWAIITLGHYYSHIVRAVDDHGKNGDEGEILIFDKDFPIKDLCHRKPA
ncbi:hypothetical protein C6A37_07295 [Desulfobacteraceae bacterium SEEP-SAG9]|nr:hypothetical protein C6A37_07295 [Desulfobacteraceae bacterium SEEP-SAG9]